MRSSRTKPSTTGVCKVVTPQQIAHDRLIGIILLLCIAVVIASAAL